MAQQAESAWRLAWCRRRLSVPDEAWADGVEKAVGRQSAQEGRDVERAPRLLCKHCTDVLPFDALLQELDRAHPFGADLDEALRLLLAEDEHLSFPSYDERMERHSAVRDGPVSRWRRRVDCHHAASRPTD
jgi:hypothetical protein